MARQSNGQYQQPANTAAVSDQTISSVAFNTLITDIGAEITNSLDRGGRSAMTAPLPMGNNKITGMADPTIATDAATKSYVDSAAAFTTGDVKLTLKVSADTGWVLLTSNVFGDGTIGNSGSNSNIRANADCLALFTLLYNNMSDADSPILTSGGAATTRAAQSSAAAAWAALCQIHLGFWAARTLAFTGNPGGGTSFPGIGNHTGAESVALSQANLPAATLTTTITDPGHTHVNTLTDPGHIHNIQLPQQGTLSGSPVTTKTSPGTNNTGATVLNVSTDSAVTGITINNASHTTGITASTALGGSGTAISLYQPTAFMNAMVKL